MAPRLLLLLMLLSRVPAQELNLRAIVHGNYNMTKVGFRVWHAISMASDDMTRIGENGDLRVFIEKIESLNDGGLKFSFHFMLLGDCVEAAVVCQKTDKNGEHSLDYKGSGRVLLWETDYRLYVTFYIRSVNNGTVTQVLALYGRFSDLGPSFLARFEKICKRYGIGPQNIIDLTSQAHLYHKVIITGNEGVDATQGTYHQCWLRTVPAIMMVENEPHQPTRGSAPA
ncbi:epididymal-specific lipocalin-9 [Artibeus jamaicensis]|uniref:epididymal-specific lipocalin-9 n=1 Tax=Artibeus jamaicensis TaxID=9417 RepID=UPI00235ACAF8|nr:epididymal-specific lipocalin-9 [Artibeus jamaicensis]